jgi:hypothetical protein
MLRISRGIQKGMLFEEKGTISNGPPPDERTRGLKPQAAPSMARMKLA